MKTGVSPRMRAAQVAPPPDGWREDLLSECELSRETAAVERDAEALRAENAALTALLARMLGRVVTPEERATLRAGRCPATLSLDQSISAVLRAQVRRYERDDVIEMVRTTMSGASAPREV